jgi:lysozyme
MQPARPGAGVGAGGIMADVKPLVVDLSHWDTADDYNAVADSGIVGVIFKATEGQSYTDNTYVQQQHAAKYAGLLWGAYHFADSSDVRGQADNFLRFACPDPDELFCLDWEDNGGDTMSADDAKTWITMVETALDRPGECVIYSGNTAKELIDGDDAFFGSRRLWLCQYVTSPSVQESWDTYWLWQYTDGASGPTPHTVDGIGACDINSYPGTASQLAGEWASGVVPPGPQPAPTPSELVSVVVVAPPGVEVKVHQITAGPPRKARRPDRSREGR